MLMVAFRGGAAVNFSQALDRIKWGQPMTRVAWNDPATYVYRLNPPDTDKINIHYSTGADFLWNPTVEDIMATDWQDTTRAE